MVAHCFDSWKRLGKAEKIALLFARGKSHRTAERFAVWKRKIFVEVRARKLAAAQCIQRGWRRYQAWARWVVRFYGEDWRTVHIARIQLFWRTLPRHREEFLFMVDEMNRRAVCIQKVYRGHRGRRIALQVRATHQCSIQYSMFSVQREKDRPTGEESMGVHIPHSTFHIPHSHSHSV